jgi:hypothetical protein
MKTTVSFLAVLCAAVLCTTHSFAAEADDDDDLSAAEETGKAASEEVLATAVAAMKNKCGNATLAYKLHWELYKKMPDSVLDGRTRGNVYGLAGDQVRPFILALGDACAESAIYKKAIGKLTFIELSPTWHKVDAAHPSHQAKKNKKSLVVSFHVTTGNTDTTEFKKVF